MSETDAGSIVGFLRLNIADYEAGIARAQSLADKLDRQDVNVNVKADTAGAETKLAAVAASEDKVAKSSKGSSTGLDSVVASARKLSDASAAANVAQLRLGEMQGSGTAKASALAGAQNTLARTQRDVSDAMKNASPEAQRLADSMGKADLSGVKLVESNKKVGSSSKDASVGMGTLIAGLLAVGPAIVPIAAGAAGLAVGFGGMGAAGILALVGIKQQMAAGTPVGGAYTSMVGTLKGDLTQLGATAAKGVLGPFQHEIANLQTQMPALNGIIGEFSVITGKTAGLLVSGLVAAFISLEPLARDVGVYVLNLSQRFATLMTGPGVKSFGDYIRSVFPAVMATVESVVTAVVHLVAAIAPMGMGSLGILRMLTDVINAIPVDVLATLAQTAAAVYIGFKSYGLLSAGVSALGSALASMGVSAETAATGMVALNIAAGVIGVAIAAATLLFSANANSTRQATQAANDYADALRTSNGAIDENIRQMTVKNLSDSGALAAARQLGLSLSTVTDAALGNSTALAAVTTTSKPFHDALILSEQGAGKSSAAITSNGHAADLLAAALGGTNTALKAGQQTYKDQAAAVAGGTVAMSAQAVAQQKVAATAGTTVTALAAATAGQQATRDAAAQAAAKMYIENDAAGILKTSLDLLNGKAISAAQAQNSFDSSLVNMGDHVDKTGKKITFTTTSINDMSSASVALRTELIGQVTSLENVVEANGGLTDSTGKALPQLAAMRQQIIDNAVAHGVDRAAVTAYIDSVLKIPKSVPPTKLDVDKAAAEVKIAVFQKGIDAIKQGKVPGVDANTAEGKAGVAALQAQILALRQGKTPTVTANIAAGTAEINSLQHQIDLIKQGKVPGLTANSKAALAVIADDQAKIDKIRQGMATPLAANSHSAMSTLDVLQSRINAIHQVMPPMLAANSHSGMSTVDVLQSRITGIHQGTPPGINANTAPGSAKLHDFQGQVNSLHGNNVTVGVKANFSMGTGGSNAFGFFPAGATGGLFKGPGSGTSDSMLARVSTGEYVINAAQTAKNLPLIKAINSGAPGFAGGGIVGLLPPSVPTRMNEASRAFMSTIGYKPGPSAAGAVGGGAVGGGAAQWATTILMALSLLGQPASLLGAVERRINFESGGNPNAINLSDSNAMAGHPSQGLMQVIPSTFAAYAGWLAGGGITNPLSNIFAGLNYALHTYGSIAAIDPLVRPMGYANGTNNAAKGFAFVGEHGKELMYFGGGEQVTSNSDLRSAQHAPASTVVNVDMSGVRADLAEQKGEIRTLGDRLEAALAAMPKAYQLNARQYA